MSQLRPDEKEDQRRAFTYGERMVGLDFNPSANDEVTEVKKTFAKLIDNVYDRRNTSADNITNELSYMVVQALLAAQMLCVKLITYKPKK